MREVIPLGQSRLSHYWSVLRNRPLRENLRRISRRVVHNWQGFKGEWYGKRGWTRPHPGHLHGVLVDRATTKTLGQGLRQRADRFFFTPLAVRDDLFRTLDRVDPTARSRAIQAAEKACAHVFDLLGSGEVALGAQIDWHTDFKTGYRWPPSTYYRRIDIRYLESDSDIKVPWELSRCQHLPTLGRAYWVTQDERYAREFVAQVSDWIVANPTGMGVNWACAMDVSIRAINWLWAYLLLRESSTLTPEFDGLFFASLLGHGRHIASNLEGQAGDNNSNHYLSDIAGLLFLGVLLPEFKEARRWSAMGMVALRTEMEGQVLADGVDYELSIGYHRLVTEIFLTCAVLCRRNEIVLPGSYWVKLERMIEFIYYCTRPDGTIPLVGDADNGRLQRLTTWDEPQREFYDHRHLLAAGAVLFNRPEWAHAAGDCWEEALWLLGEEAIAFLRSNESACAGEIVASRGFPHAGIYVLRAGELYALVDAGGNGTGGIGNHNHNDTLSVEVFAYDAPLIVDPGAYVYTADPVARNLFRSSRFHNTILVDGEEINRFDPRVLFRLEADAVAEVQTWQSGEAFDLLVASHRGYCRLSDPVVPSRTVFFDKHAKLWLILDQWAARGTHDYTFPFHFATPHAREVGGLPKAVVAHASNGVEFLVCPLHDPGLAISLRQGWISRSYGCRERTRVAEYSAQLSGDGAVVWGLYPSPEVLPSDAVIRSAFRHSYAQLAEQVPLPSLRAI